MAKRSDTLETVLLAVELMRRIPRGRKVTASELHQQLKDAGIERELRTIQRQLEMLSEHFEIERDDRSKPFSTFPAATRQEVLQRLWSAPVVSVAPSLSTTQVLRWPVSAIWRSALHVWQRPSWH